MARGFWRGCALLALVREESPVDFPGATYSASHVESLRESNPSLESKQIGLVEARLRKDTIVFAHQGLEWLEPWKTRVNKH